MLDIVATSVLAVLAFAAAAGALVMSPFLVMATDSADQDANLKPMGWAFAVTWGGTAAGVIVAIGGIVLAANRNSAMWIWPALGLLVIGLTFGVGALLATRVAKKPIS